MTTPTMILRAKGPQDKDLMIKPGEEQAQGGVFHTFWKATYPKHSNFCLIDEVFTPNTGTVRFGGRMTFQPVRSGDLIQRMWLYFKMPQVVRGDNNHLRGVKVFIDDLGRGLIDDIKFNIGGYDIEHMTGDFMHIWDKLSRTSDASFVDNMPVAHGGTGQVNPAAVQERVSSNMTYPLQVNDGTAEQHIYVPLMFSFCSAYDQAYPIIAVQYHDTEIRLKLNELQNVSALRKVAGHETWVVPVSTQAWQNGQTVENPKDADDVMFLDTNTSLTEELLESVELVARYVYLGDFERVQFALSPHQYLITETQHTDIAVNGSDTKKQQQLFFNHPVKELIIHYRPTLDCAMTSWNALKHTANYWNFTAPDIGTPSRREALQSLQLQFNQQNYFPVGRDAIYYGYVLPETAHKRVVNGHDRVYVMPFALEPERLQPTSSVNFSRLDTKMLLIDIAHSRTPYDPTNPEHEGRCGSFHIYARSHNIFKLVSGMGGKRYAA